MQSFVPKFKKLYVYYHVVFMSNTKILQLCIIKIDSLALSKGIFFINVANVCPCDSISRDREPPINC